MSLSLDIPVGALRAIQRLLTFAPSNMDIIVVASEDKLTQLTFAMLMKFDETLRRSITFSKTCDDARLLLVKYRAQEFG